MKSKVPIGRSIPGGASSSLITLGLFTAEADAVQTATDAASTAIARTLRMVIPLPLDGCQPPVGLGSRTPAAKYARSIGASRLSFGCSAARFAKGFGPLANPSMVGL